MIPPGLILILEKSVGQTGGEREKKKKVRKIRGLDRTISVEQGYIVSYYSLENKYVQSLGRDFQFTSSVSVLGLILRVVRSIDVIGDDSISFIPLLVVVLLEVLVGWVDSEALGNDGGQFELFVGLVQQDVVLLIEHT